jgi:hypothetical protein
VEGGARSNFGGCFKSPRSRRVLVLWYLQQTQTTTTRRPVRLPPLLPDGLGRSTADLIAVWGTEY